MCLTKDLKYRSCISLFNMNGLGPYDNWKGYAAPPKRMKSWASPLIGRGCDPSATLLSLHPFQMETDLSLFVYWIETVWAHFTQDISYMNGGTLISVASREAWPLSDPEIQDFIQKTFRIAWLTKCIWTFQQSSCVLWIASHKVS